MLTREELRERDNRQLLAEHGRPRTIGDTADVQSLLVDEDSRLRAARVSAGNYSEYQQLICMTEDLPAAPVPMQQLIVDGVYHIVDAVKDEEGMLYITLETRRA